VQGLVEDPSHRMTLAEALQHPWLASTENVTPIRPPPHPALEAIWSIGQKPTPHTTTHTSPITTTPSGLSYNSSTWRITDFEVGPKLGSGRFGCVYKCRCKKSAKVVAIKTLFKDQLMENGMVHQLKNEIEIHCQIIHPHIVRCYGYFHDDQRGK